MPTVTSTTRLAAINTIISMIGSAPVSQAVLDATPQPPEVEQVNALLDTFDLAIQEQGWDWNTEERTLSRETDDTILTPDDAIDVHKNPEKEFNTNPIKRGSILFDRKNRTTKFENDVEALVTVRLPFTDLPEAARKYITIRAGRTFVANYDNSEILWQYSRAEEGEARAALMREVLRSGSFGLGNTREHKSYKRYTL